MDNLFLKSVYYSTSLGIDIITLLVTTIVAFFAYRIAANQLKLQKHQLKYDLYDRRYKVYEELKNSFGDYDDKMMAIKDYSTLYKNYISWFNRYHDELKFLFEKRIYKQAKTLYDLFNTNTSVKNNTETDNKIPGHQKVYDLLKDDMGKQLTFQNLE